MCSLAASTSLEENKCFSKFSYFQQCKGTAFILHLCKKEEQQDVVTSIKGTCKPTT